MPVMIWMEFKSNNPALKEKAKERAISINDEPGFLWKIWTSDVESGNPGGIYCFDTLEHANDYIAMHKARLEKAGATEIRFKTMYSLEELSKINHAPI